jgi:hypothetical protein
MHQAADLPAGIGGWDHSMRMLERVAKALNARVRVVLEPLKPVKA